MVCYISCCFSTTFTASNFFKFYRSTDQEHDGLCTIISPTNDTKNDVLSFGLIFYQVVSLRFLDICLDNFFFLVFSLHSIVSDVIQLQILEGRLINNINVEYTNLKLAESEKKFHNRCPGRILQ